MQWPKIIWGLRMPMVMAFEKYKDGVGLAGVKRLSALDMTR